jgi:hypothetical protein
MMSTIARSACVNDEGLDPDDAGAAAVGGVLAVPLLAGSFRGALFLGPLSFGPLEPAIGTLPDLYRTQMRTREECGHRPAGGLARMADRP